MKPLEKALEYAAQGWKVFPLLSKSKVPMTSQGFLEATTDTARIDHFFNWNGPTYPNIGVRTGSESGIAVLDIDDNGEALEARLSRLGLSPDLPKTYTVRTPSGGLHLYFKYQEGLRNRASIGYKGSGIDFRAEGGYVVAPPSVDASGAVYEVIDDTEIVAVPTEWLQVLLRDDKEPLQVVAGNGAVLEGGRNDYLTRVAGKLQRSNLLTLEALQSVNERDCNPPLPSHEVETIFHSISRYQPAEGPTDNVIELPQGPKPFALRSASERQASFQKDQQNIQRAREGQIAFLGEPWIFVPSTGVTLVAAQTGRGKTITAANQVADYLKRGTKQVVVLLNEELSADFVARVACVLLKKPFFRYRNGDLDGLSVGQIQDKIQELLQRIEIVSAEDHDLTDADEILKIIQVASHSEDVGLCLLDYLQNITHSSQNPLFESPYSVSKYLGTELVRIGQTAKCPVMIFAQVRFGDTPLYDRVQGDKTFVNNCALAIEIVSDHEKRTTEFIIQKDRWFGSTGKTISRFYVEGRLEDRPPLYGE